MLDFTVTVGSETITVAFVDPPNERAAAIQVATADGDGGWVYGNCTYETVGQAVGDMVDALLEWGR